MSTTGWFMRTERLVPSELFSATDPTIPDPSDREAR